MNEKDEIKLYNKVYKMIKERNLSDIQQLNDITSLYYETYGGLFMEACAHDATDIVKYFYELKKPFNFALHEGFRCCLDLGHFTTAKLLICDLKIHQIPEVNEEIKKELKILKGWDKEFYDQIITLFPTSNNKKLKT